ncbi:N-methyltransferase [Lachnellula hyalina]|uniref:N-methyltransferase n=1 Tax=Lachnellula hyalina TaxID=1316788 RepID=A0A8H8U218_9HELO|nr:N-methyltransferase [Lachnellula hyalina]TVY28507.1 N-methyltransferase [Lachnellula hyalina]
MFLTNGIVQLLDIRKSSLLDLKSEIISGLTGRGVIRTMPSLLLWDDEGLENFYSWAKSPDYYPSQREMEILRTQGLDIVRKLPKRLVLIELGCGSLTKTVSILENLEKEGHEVSYFALDVSEEALRQNLGAMSERFKSCGKISISGFIGTYEDCVEWLTTSANLPVSTVTFLWVGNSIANLSKTEASALMSRFREACCKISIDCSFLVTADCCTAEDRLVKAYDPDVSSARTFLYHGLHHANRLMGENIFEANHWKCIMKYEQKENELLFSYVAKQDVEVDVHQLHVTVKKGEEIHYFLSGKWSQAQMRVIAENAGFEVRKTWTDAQNEYC